ncbi:MAG TPA: GNAT family N-acetyltransferase [Lacunisphaera sp.]|jgi:GNAT superfamily N-acetyltransferase|nr:GNAT family N-acetyltransferase [Lacunisphaera sp.]
MRITLQLATPEDAEAIAALRNAVSDDLTFKHGKGPWTAHSTTAGVIFDLRNAKLFVVLQRGEAVASLILDSKKPWAIELNNFPKAKCPLYLTAMVVAPEHQRQGLGRACLAEAVKIARRAKAGAIFLDAFDHPAAGAGAFYAKCGCRETGRATYREIPLIYYERAIK